MNSVGDNSESGMEPVIINLSNDVITIKNNKVLGVGNGGTIVYEGTFDHRDVAVKRIPKEAITKSERTRREVGLNRNVIEHHENVVTYYYTGGHTYYIVMLDIFYTHISVVKPKFKFKSQVSNPVPISKWTRWG